MRIYNANANPNQWRTWTPPKSYLPKGDPESRSPTASSRSPSPRQERLGSNNLSPENALKRYETTLAMASPSNGTPDTTSKHIDSQETQELQVSRPPPIRSQIPSTPTSKWPSVESRMQNLSLTHNPKVLDSPASSLTAFSVEDETTTTTTTTTTKRSTTARYLFPQNGFRFDISSSDTTTKDSSSLSEQDGNSSSTISTGSTLLMKNSHHKTPSPPRHENQVKTPPLESNESSPSNISDGREAHQSMKIPSPPSEQRRNYDDGKSPFFVLQSRPMEINYSPPQRPSVVTSRSLKEEFSPDRQQTYENDDPPCPLPEESSPPPSPENEQCPKLAPTTTTEAESESESDESSTSPWREFPNHGIFPGQTRRDSPACVSPRLVSSNSIPFNPFVHSQHDPFVSQHGGNNINGDKERDGYGSSEIVLDSPVVMRWNHSDDKPPGVKISSGGVAIQELRDDSSKRMKNKHRNKSGTHHTGGRGKIILSVKKGSTSVQDSNVKGTMLFPTKKLVPKGRLACTCSECHPRKMTRIPSPPRPHHHQASTRRSQNKKLGKKCQQPRNNNAASSPTTSFIINKYPNLFRKYSAMFKVGFSLEGVTNAMEKDNVDPTLIDLITCASQVESTTLP